MNMDKLHELRDLLNSMNEILDKLLEIENKKTAVLEKGDVEDLNKIMTQEQSMIMQCSALEKQRIELCDGLEVQTMSQLYEKLPESSEMISPIHSKMTETIKNIKKVSGLNIRLLDTRLSIVKLITSKMGYEKENTTYGKNAQLN